MPASDLDIILNTLDNSETNTTTFGDNWSQGRSAYGGLASAFATSAMRKLLPEKPPIRSLMVSFIGPLPPGEVKVDASTLRQGKNVTQLSASVLSENKLCLQAMGVFGKSREGLAVPSSYEFNPVSRDQGISFETPSKRMPSFLSSFDGYWVSKGLPFSGKPSRKMAMWVRHKVDMSAHPVEKIVTIADMPPPVVLSYFDKPPVPASSLTWSLEFVESPETVNTDWFYLEFTVEAAANGYTQQEGKIFTEDGQLCALSRQCMVYFG